MLKGFFVIPVLLPFVILSQTNLSGTKKEPCITPFGKPSGNIVTAKMDNKGGELRSGDGNLEIIFPAGALDVETSISVQAIHN